MYYCSDCRMEFEFAKVYFEPTPKGSEKLLLCPYCSGMNYSEKRGNYCSYCGRPTGVNVRRYCSESCRKLGEKMFEKEKEQEENRKKSPLYKAVNEVDTYNKYHGCKLSYGQYYALKGAGII